MTTVTSAVTDTARDLSALALLAWTIQPEPPKYTTPLTPTLFIYPEPEDIDSLRFS